MKVIAIDDSKLALSQVERLIKEIIPNMEILKFQNPREGIEIAKKQCAEIDFILVDYNMDTMTGLDVIDEIISLYKVNQIALLTANTQSSIKEEVEKRGIHFLSKEGLKDQLFNIFNNLSLQDSK